MGPRSWLWVFKRYWLWLPWGVTYLDSLNMKPLCEREFTQNLGSVTMGLCLPCHPKSDNVWSSNSLDCNCQFKWIMLFWRVFGLRMGHWALEERWITLQLFCPLKKPLELLTFDWMSFPKIFKPFILKEESEKHVRKTCCYLLIQSATLANILICHFFVDIRGNALILYKFAGFLKSSQKKIGFSKMFHKIKIRNFS